MKLGSLFDGIGGFPFVAQMCGIEPVWASEVEPFPIANTRYHFPNMKHLGNVMNINGAEIEPVDIITFGSPCQDMSVAGKRKGLKHEEKGDDETTRSGLFMEAVRIIKEMREKTNGKYPTFAVWENVPGAFSSNKGEDFRVVLEEMCKIKDSNANIPRPNNGKWPTAGAIMGTGYSAAWRTIDAQFWGVPQRRRRIYLVADFGGQSAPEILFKPESVSWDIATGRKEGQGIARAVEGCFGETSGVDIYNGELTGNIAACLNAASGSSATHSGPSVLSAFCLQGNGINRADTAGCNGKGWTEDVCYTLNTVDRPAVYSFDSLASNSMKSTNPHSGCREVEIAKTLDTTNPDPSKNQGGIAVVILNDQGGSSINVEQEEISPTLRANGGDLGGGSERLIANQSVRRLTPLECCRLQGYPDYWHIVPTVEDMTDDEYDFWAQVYITDKQIKGKTATKPTKKRLIAWYNKLGSDSAYYRAYGNSLALPCAFYVIHSIAATNEPKE